MNIKSLYMAKVHMLLVVMLSFVCERANADFTFGKPQNLGPVVNSPLGVGDGTPGISADGLTLYFGSDRPGGLGRVDLWVTTRQNTNGPWGPPVNLTTVNSPYSEGYPSVSADELTLYFSDVIHRPDRPGGQGGHDLWMTTRAGTADPWSTPVNLGPIVNSSADEQSPTISHDGLTLIFASTRGGGSGNYDLWMSTRPTIQRDWGPPVNIGPLVNSSSYDQECCLSCDGLALLFMSGRSGGLGGSDAWVTVRKSISDPWGPPVNLGPPVSTSVDDGSVVISTDGRMLYFASSRAGGVGGLDIWQVSINPVVDFNGDGKVSVKDFSRLAQYWQQDESSVDMGPTPLGNGLVDIQDLAVLAEYWLVEFGLVAHWKLDGTEGLIAHDSIGNHDGFVLSANPLWRPTGGIVSGALELDGIDDFVSVPFVLDPADGPFSVFAWIKGGAAGQVVLSQIGAANWLLADAEGKLMTALVSGGRFGGTPLVSEFIIIDGHWHHIALVWDGERRQLYVDGAEVAKDTIALSSLLPSDDGLYIGAGKDKESGSFFCGFIDDVKIYNQAIVP
jgi:hypothetical protein